MQTARELGALLVEWKVLTDEQLRAAGATANGTRDDFIRALASQRAWWDRGKGNKTPQPALTKYQQNQIRKKADNPAALRRALRQKHYLVLSSLGKGGMGVVHLGWDLNNNTLVALKRVRVPNADARSRLRREFEAMKKLSAYPVVVRALDMFTVKDSDVLVMEYQNGGDLSSRLAKGKLPWRQAARWAVALLDGLAAAHAAGLIHRDIKPSNVMIHKTADQQLVRLSDWGLVKDLVTEATAATNAGLILGSFHYMPPEQWSQKPVVASDLYALGCTLYHAVTGRTPFGDPDPTSAANAMAPLCRAHTLEPTPSVRAFSPDVPPEVEALIQRMMAKLPAVRGTATELSGEFRRLLEEAPAAPAEPTPRSARSARPATRTQSTSALPTPLPSPPPVVPVNRPPTPSELQLARDSQVPLGAAFAQLFRAMCGWGRQRASHDPLADASASELGNAWRTFGVSLRVWMRSLTQPTQHPGRVATVIALIGVFALLVWLVVR